MNIFALERKSDGSIDWEASANSHDTYRTNKMYLESTQMLATNANFYGFQTRYRNAHLNHPSTIWARESLTNYRNLLVLAGHLRSKFLDYSGKDSHGCDDVWKHCLELSVMDKKFASRFPSKGNTPLPLCMPDEYKTDNIVESYRDFFANKPRLRYIEGTVPQWVYDYRINPDPIEIVPLAEYNAKYKTK